MAQAGGTVGDRFGLPHVTVCNALAMNRDPDVPPGVLPWRFRLGPLGRLRNAFGDKLPRLRPSLALLRPGFCGTRSVSCAA